MFWVGWVSRKTLSVNVGITAIQVHSGESAVYYYRRNEYECYTEDSERG